MDMFLHHVLTWLVVITLHWLLGLSYYLGNFLPYAMLFFIVCDYFRLLPVRMFSAQYTQILTHLITMKKRVFTKELGEGKAYKSILETTTEFSAIVWPGDLDIFLHMNNAQYLQKMEW